MNQEPEHTLDTPLSWIEPVANEHGQLQVPRSPKEDFALAASEEEMKQARRDLKKAERSIRAIFKAQYLNEPGQFHLGKMFDRLNKIAEEGSDSEARQTILGVLAWMEPPKTADIKVEQDNRRVVIYSNGDPE